jgi:hypothetical protein
VAEVHRLEVQQVLAHHQLAPLVRYLTVDRAPPAAAAVVQVIMAAVAVAVHQVKLVVEVPVLEVEVLLTTDTQQYQVVQQHLHNLDHQVLQVLAVVVHHIMHLVLVRVVLVQVNLHQAMWWVVTVMLFSLTLLIRQIQQH